MFVLLCVDLCGDCGGISYGGVWFIGDVLVVEYSVDI